jgi:hypothetical protein
MHRIRLKNKDKQLGLPRMIKNLLERNNFYAELFLVLGMFKNEEQRKVYKTDWDEFICQVILMT